jgi:hypothetical protein
MATHLLNPSAVRINYHSVFAQHTMTLPTRAWNPLAGTNGFGGYEAWDLSERDAQDMIEGLVFTFVDVLHSSVVFDNWVIYNEASPGGVMLPVASDIFAGVVGTEATPGWYEAVQGIFTFYDTSFNTAKISILEYASKNNFARRTYTTASAPEVAIADEYMVSSNAWSSRAGFRPSTLRSLSLGINDALKKQYPTI